MLCFVPILVNKYFVFEHNKYEANFHFTIILVILETKSTKLYFLYNDYEDITNTSQEYVVNKRIGVETEMLIYLR